MKNILIPVDGSANSLRAVHYVIDYVREHGPCTVHLLNVQPLMASGIVPTFIGQETIQEYYEVEAGAALAEAKAAMDKAGVTYLAAHRIGSVADSIAAYATEHQCDHIVMGSRGLGAVESLLLGSVTLKVLHLIHIPAVLIN
ncbi:MAG TPA: universal stress protein [Bordetella sp.]